MKKMVIAVSGPPGSGKTTYSKRLARDLGLRYVSAGMLFRKIASERGVSIVKLSLIAESDPSIDFEVDRRTLKEALTGNVVLDGHLTAWVVRHLADFTVYVTAPLIVRVNRIARRDNIPLEEALKETVTREVSQKQRYFKYYGIDVTDTSWFDLIINTEKLTVDEAYEIIKASVVKALSKRNP